MTRRRLPLTANSIAILRMHHAGIPHDRIAYLGEHRGAWSAGDVARFVADWGTPDRDPVGYGLSGPGGFPREHGTPRGYQQHRTYDEDACEPCKASRRVKAS